MVSGSTSSAETDHVEQLGETDHLIHARRRSPIRFHATPDDALRRRKTFCRTRTHRRPSDKVRRSPRCSWNPLCSHPRTRFGRARRTPGKWIARSGLDREYRRHVSIRGIIEARHKYSTGAERGQSVGADAQRPCASASFANDIVLNRFKVDPLAQALRPCVEEQLNFNVAVRSDSVTRWSARERTGRCVAALDLDPSGEVSVQKHLDSAIASDHVQCVWCNRRRRSGTVSGATRRYRVAEGLKRSRLRSTLLGE